MSDKTPTERVRKMLDERGIPWVELRDGKTAFESPILGVRVSLTECDSGFLVSAGYKALPPEQAIAATVGAGTCHIEVHDNLDESEGMGDVWLECDKCHWQMMLEPTTPRFKHCPNCRRRVVDE